MMFGAAIGDGRDGEGERGTMGLVGTAARATFFGRVTQEIHVSAAVQIHVVEQLWRAC